MRVEDREAVEFRELGPDDVPSLVSCIRACYGDSYSEPDFYDPTYLRTELGAGRLLCIGALVAGRVVGHIGTRMPAPGDPIADTIGGVVHPDYRGAGLTVAMGARMVAAYPERGIVGVRHLATGAHDRTQRLLVASGAVATGVLLGHVPATIDYRGIDHQFANHRIGLVVYFQTFGHLDPCDVYLPEQYRWVTDLYTELNLERRVLAPPSRGSVADGTGSVAHDDRDGISTVRLGRLARGALLPAGESIDQVCASRNPVAYADLPLADPRTPADVERLRHEGFCFGALLPGLAVSETLRMQRVDSELVAPASIITASINGHALLERIAGEHQSLADVEHGGQT